MTNQQITVTLGRELVEHLFERCTEATNTCEVCRAIGTQLRSALDAGEETVIELGDSEKLTRVLTAGEWDGRPVGVSGDEACPGHDLEPVDHFGEPTCWLMCSRCQGIALKPEPDSRLTTEEVREKIHALPKEDGIADGFFRRSTVLAAFPDPKEPTQ